jgi:hypothetical protein
VASLKQDGNRGEARQLLRSLIDRIVILADCGPDWWGNPEKMLTAAVGGVGTPAVGQDGCGGALPPLPTALYVVAV